MTDTMADRVVPLPVTSVPDPVISRFGLGYRAHFRAAGIELELRRVRARSDEIHGYLTVRVPRVSVDPVYYGRVNLSTTTSRAALAKYLRTRVDLDWAGVIERFALKVLDDQFTGSSSVQLGVGDQVRETRRYHLRPLVREGDPITVYGLGGTGKTTFARFAAFSSASGRTLVEGIEPAGADPALVLDWETDRTDWDAGIRAISRGYGIPVPEIHYRRMAGNLADQIEEIAAEVAEKGITLVIVDSVEAATGGDSDNLNDRANRLYDAIRHLDVTAILLDHLASADIEREDAAPKPINGIMKLNRARGAFLLKREKEPTAERAELLLINTKVNTGSKHPPIGFVFEYENDEDGNLVALRAKRTEATAPELVRNLSTADRMARLLAGGSVREQRIADELNVSSATVRSALNRHPDRFIRLQDGSIGVRARG